MSEIEKRLNPPNIYTFYFYLVERRRRFNINDRIKELGTLLPTQNEPYYELVRAGGGEWWFW